jgi:hypothetical protein
MYAPPINGKINPAIIAEINPTIGGTPDAIAIPDESGSETSETTIPERISWRICLSPAIPF